MRFLRFGWRAIVLIVWIMVGLLTLTVVFPWLPEARRQPIIQRWSQLLVAACGVKTQSLGHMLTGQPVLFVANHVSWLDIFVINVYRPTVFVAKSEIRRWPVLGWLVAGAGTVFIERHQRHAIKEVAQQMQKNFTNQLAVGLFPEGTTSEGKVVKPFHSSLFQTAIETAVDIQPIALRYYENEKRSARVAFTGDQTLVQNVWLLLSQPGTRVHCEFLPVLLHQDNAAQGRLAIAQAAHQAIEQAVLRD